MQCSVVSFHLRSASTTAASSRGTPAANPTGRGFPWESLSECEDCPEDPRVASLGFRYWKKCCCFELGPAFSALGPYGGFSLNLRRFKNVRYYRDTGKRVRDETNRRRAGQKRLACIESRCQTSLTDSISTRWGQYRNNIIATESHVFFKNLLTTIMMTFNYNYQGNLIEWPICQNDSVGTSSCDLGSWGWHMMLI